MFFQNSKLNIHEIEPNDIVLSPKLLKKYPTYYPAFQMSNRELSGVEFIFTKSKRQLHLWEFFTFFPISRLMLLVLIHFTPL